VYDDLAVAQHKLGDHRAAIATMEAKERALPGIYETYSNMGTFYIYTGELDEAAKWIERALHINPNAHFGREKYQLWLVQWIKAGMPQGAEGFSGDTLVRFTGFAPFVAARSGYNGKPHEWAKGRDEALRGITGMMRFADHDNPLLLEALGDMLTVGEFSDNASLLAAQSYLHASRRSKTDAEKQRLWKKMERAGGTVDEYKPRDTMRALDAALAEGAKFAERVRQDEIAWIKTGKDVTAEFGVKYLKAAK
jgi:tetratricopeptide (TPR) repeat protein